MQVREAAVHSTVEFLLRRMAHKSDFPALGEAVARIHRVASDEQANLSNLANEILKDVALTHKLLRLVELDSPDAPPIGAKLTKGLGAGSDPNVGKAAALEDTEQLLEALQGAELMGRPLRINEARPRERR